MNKLTKEKRIQVIASLVEGNSIRSTCRMTDVAKGTVLKLLRDIGAACTKYQDSVFINLPCKRIQCDEIWSFCYSKHKNVPKDKEGKFGYGNVWTWTALCADTKLVPSWYIGSRDAISGMRFLRNLKKRLKYRVQLTTDSHKAYLVAVNHAFGDDVDYAMLVKRYGHELGNNPEVRYSQPPVVSVEENIIKGTPEKEHISTSFVERNNLNLRMGMRRFTRLTNAFSKKVENLACAVALHFMYYNFCRVHQTLGITPAMAAQITDRVWKIDDIVALLGEEPKGNIKRQRSKGKIKPSFRNRLLPYLTRSQRVSIPAENILVSN